jgi:7-cyano-7-deazaguanine synthase
MANDFNINMLTFDYGQRAKMEIERARYFSKTLKAKDHKVLDISFMKALYGNSNALTDSKQELVEDFTQNLVVPVRNAVFITIAWAWASGINAKVIAYGAHTDDIQHYPDCRPIFVKSINKALNIAESDNTISGLRREITVVSPAIMRLDKCALLKTGYLILGNKIFQTWSCYSGRCESCINRKNAFISAQIEDKTQYATESGYKRKGKA